jgi:tripeptide aminopeptidase
MNDLITRMLDLAITIQQIPAPTFHEIERAEFVRAQFSKEGLVDVEKDSAGNVYSRLPGSNRGDKLVICAHLDTVFPAGADLQYTREPERVQAPGIGDNSLGVAALFGLVWALRERQIILPGDLWLVANVCEEGLGDLRGIRAVVERFGTDLPGYIILEGIALGHIYHRGLGVRRYRITIRTSGGHSWIDYGQPSAIHELARLATRITELKPPRSPRSSLNIGIISGGSSVNTIAAEAILELDLRSEEPETLAELAAQVTQLVKTAERNGVTVEMEEIGQRPSGGIAPNHPLVRLAQDCLRGVGIEPHLNTGSTDANLPLSLDIPAVTIGLTTGGRAHSMQEYINTPPLEKGLEQVVALASRAWNIGRSDTRK